MKARAERIMGVDDAHILLGEAKRNPEPGEPIDHRTSRQRERGISLLVVNTVDAFGRQRTTIHAPSVSAHKVGGRSRIHSCQARKGRAKHYYRLTSLKFLFLAAGGLNPPDAVESCCCTTHALVA